MKRIFYTFYIVLISMMSVSCAGILTDLGLGSDTKSSLASDDSDHEGTCDSDEEDCGDSSDRAIVRRKTSSEEGDGFERISGASGSMRQRVRAAIESNDVIPGMTRTEVMESWGAPIVREFSGQGESGHERWTYGTRNSMRGETYLIFENGHVVGWHR